MQSRDMMQSRDVVCATSCVVLLLMMVDMNCSWPQLLGDQLVTVIDYDVAENHCQLKYIVRRLFADAVNFSVQK